MTFEQKLLLKLMAMAIRQEKPDSLPEETDWKELFREAFAQAVPMLFFETISQLQQVPEQIYQKSFTLARRSTAHNLRAEHTQAELVEVLESGEHPYVILKGEAAAAYYPRPELRMLGDVDFLLQDGHAGAVVEKLTARGYQPEDTQQEYHQALIRGKEQMELHFEVAGIPQGRLGVPVREYLKTVFAEYETVTRGSGTYRVPCAAHHGLILLLHMQHHTQSHGMGLRHIMDWACFVNQTAKEEFWEQRLLPLLKRIGLLRYCQVMTKLCSIFLETACPEWAQEVPEQLCRELMEDLLSGGNFGGKDPERSRSTGMLPDWTEERKAGGKWSNLIRTLQESVVRDKPELENKPVARTAAMAGKVLRYCVLFCAGKRPNILKAAAHADTRRSIYDQLEMFQTEE